MTGYRFSTPPIDAVDVADGVGAVTVNGPEDEALDWDAIDWRVHEDNVARLRRRIFTATREQD
jgi:hypothetical protein